MRWAHSYYTLHVIKTWESDRRYAVHYYVHILTEVIPVKYVEDNTSLLLDSESSPQTHRYFVQASRRGTVKSNISGENKNRNITISWHGTTVLHSGDIYYCCMYVLLSKSVRRIKFWFNFSFLFLPPNPLSWSRYDLLNSWQEGL